MIGSTATRQAKQPNRLAVALQWTPRSSRARAWAFVALCLIALASLVAIYQIPYHRTLEVGSPGAEGRVRGFHDAERDGDFTYRWTTARAVVRLPQGVFPGAVAVVLSGKRPGSPPPTVTLSVGSQTASVQSGDGFTTYPITLSARDGSLNPARVPYLTIAPADTLTPPLDNRALGVAVQRVVVYTNPLRFGPVVPPLLAVLLVLGVALSLALVALSLAPPAWLLGPFVLAPVWLSAAYLALRRADDPGEQVQAVAGFAVAAFVALAVTQRRRLAGRPWVRAVAWFDGRWALLATLLLTLGYALYATHALYGRLYDDAYITLRYARNFADGHGLRYNLKERPVEGYTNFSLTVLLALFAKLGLPLVAMAKICSVVAALGVVLATYWLTGIVLPNAPGVLRATPGALLAGCGWFAFFAVIGLETHLFALAVTVGACLVLRGRWTWAGFAFTFAYLTRPEGAGLWAVTLLWLLLAPRSAGRREHSARWWDAAEFAWPFVIIGGAHEGFRLWYYGEPLPNTFYDKVGTTFSQVRRGLEYLVHILPTLHPFTLALLITLVALVPSAAVWGRAARYLALLVAAFAAYIALVGGDFIGPRFLFHIFPLIVVLLVAGVRSLVGWLPPMRRITRASSARETVLPALCAVAIAVWLWLPLVPPGTFTPEQAHMRIVTGLSVLGEYLQANAPPGATLAVEVAGIVPYESGLRTIDMLGLNDFHIAHAIVATGEARAGHEKMDPQYVIDRKPMYIAVGMTSRGRPGRGLDLPGFDDQYARIALVRMNASVATPDLVLPITPTTNIEAAMRDGYTYALYQRR